MAAGNTHIALVAWRALIDAVGEVEQAKYRVNVMRRWSETMPTVLDRPASRQKILTYHPRMYG
jgi:hypothetical protein